jgi:hypothetical protein
MAYGDSKTSSWSNIKGPGSNNVNYILLGTILKTFQVFNDHDDVDVSCPILAYHEFEDDYHEKFFRSDPFFSSKIERMHFRVIFKVLSLLHGHMTQ